MMMITVVLPVHFVLLFIPLLRITVVATTLCLLSPSEFFCFVFHVTCFIIIEPFKYVSLFFRYDFEIAVASYWTGSITLLVIE